MEGQATQSRPRSIARATDAALQLLFEMGLPPSVSSGDRHVETAPRCRCAQPDARAITRALLHQTRSVPRMLINTAIPHGCSGMPDQSRPHNDAGKPRSPRAAQQDENLGNPAWLSGSPQGRDRSPDENGSIQTPAFSGQAGRAIYAERERVKVTRSCPARAGRHPLMPRASGLQTAKDDVEMLDRVTQELRPFCPVCCNRRQALLTSSRGCSLPLAWCGPSSPWSTACSSPIRFPVMPRWSGECARHTRTTSTVRASSSINCGTFGTTPRNRWRRRRAISASAAANRGADDEIVQPDNAVRDVSAALTSCSSRMAPTRRVMASS